jgi:hypothetical protein
MIHLYGHAPLFSVQECMSQLNCSKRRLYDIITKLLRLKILRKNSTHQYQFRPLPEIIQSLSQITASNDSDNLLFLKLMEENSQSVEAE